MKERNVKTEHDFHYQINAQAASLSRCIYNFLEKGSGRRPKPIRDKETEKDIQETGMISDIEVTAEAMDNFSDDTFLRKKYI